MSVEITFQYTPGDNPERYIVEYDSTIVIDTLFVGGSAYDYGGDSRRDFVNSIASRGLLEPTNVSLAPDNYPYVYQNTLSSVSFDKVTAVDRVFVRIYSPLDDPKWEFSITQLQV